MVKNISFIAAVGDLDYLVNVSKLNHGSIDIYVVKPERQGDGSFQLVHQSGGFVFGTVNSYGDQVRCHNEYFFWDPERIRQRFETNVGDCFTMDDKDALLDRLREAGMIGVD